MHLCRENPHSGVEYPGVKSAVKKGCVVQPCFLSFLKIRMFKTAVQSLSQGHPPHHHYIYSSSSPPTVASCLSWYSVIRSRTFLSASWNSISSMPSPLYQWRNALRLYMAPNWVASRWKMPFRAVVLATKVHEDS